MTQNKSNAVMATRIEPNDSLDDFPTGPWTARALFEHVLPHRGINIWEPAANRGFMVRGLKDYGKVIGSDVYDYGAGFPVMDFLWHGTHAAAGTVDFIITNPPFRLAEKFIAKALEEATLGCAMFVRTVFVESEGRYERLFRSNPPTIIAFFSERVLVTKGRLLDPEIPILNTKTGKMEKPSTATSYSWLVWHKGAQPQPAMWIPPCRAQLERPGDYIL